ncbi:MAG: hypothetical protein ACYCPW_06290, partial [Nitrososphaerales archaeon]
ILTVVRVWELIGRQIQRLKDMTECFDDTFPCRSVGVKCRLKHVKNCINVFFLHQQPEFIEFTEIAQPGSWPKVTGHSCWSEGDLCAE